MKRLLLFMSLSMLCGCQQMKFWIVNMLSDKAVSKPVQSSIVGSFENSPSGYAKHTIAVKLFADGFAQPTDIQFTRHLPNFMFVAEKTGALKVYDLQKKTVTTAVKVPVVTDSEMGLLGLAFDKDFPKNRQIYLNYNIKEKDAYYTLVTAWKLQTQPALSAKKLKTLLKVKQPYPNHNAGQLVIGPKGHLYVGFGDGGWADDPHRHGQNKTSLLGSMQRINVKTGKRETWATGLRNPWRYSFDRAGRLIVADVGQNAWEEVSIIDRPGLNLGWNVMEANHCFKKKTCRRQGYQPAVIEYSHSEGQSITGGYVSEHSKHALNGHYIYGDFVSGRLWAAKLPTKSQQVLKPKQIKYLGKWPLMVSTFGKDTQGRIYIADFNSGGIYQVY